MSQGYSATELWLVKRKRMARHGVAGLDISLCPLHVVHVRSSKSDRHWSAAPAKH